MFTLLRVLALVMSIASLGILVYSMVQNNREKISDREENILLHFVITLMCLSSIFDIIARGWIK